MNYNQSRILDLLKEIDSICRPKKIPFYLAAGSMIGAMRHGGFIPWDDDADVYMKMADWDRFVEAFNENPIPNRMLVDPIRHPESGYPIHRYVDTTTSELYRYHLSSPQQDGIMIDFLILADIPDTEAEQIEFVKIFTEYSNVLVKATSFAHKCPVPTATSELRNRVKCEGEEAVLADYRAKLFSYPEGSCHHLMQCDAGVPHIWKADVFAEPRYVPFENTEMPVATKVFDALVGAFNEDWMYIPPSADQEAHLVTRDYCIGDGVILKDAQQFYNQEEVTENYIERNWRVIETAEDIKAVNADLNWFAAEYVRMKYEGCDLVQVHTWLEEGNFEALDDFYERYFFYQCSKRHLGAPSYDGWFRAHYPIYIDCGDDFLVGALHTLMHKKQLSAVRRILLARKRSLGPLTPDLQAIEEEHAAIYELLSAYYMEDNSRALDLLETCVQRYPNNPYVLDMQLRKTVEEDLEQASVVAEKHLVHFPSSSVARKILGDYQRINKRYPEAAETYRELIIQSLDGVVLKALRDDLSADQDFLANELGMRIFEAVNLSLSGQKPKACDLLEQK